MARTASKTAPWSMVSSAMNCRSTRGRPLPVRCGPRVSGSCFGSFLSIALLVSLGTSNVFSEIAVFFSKMAMVTFGGAYAVLAYVAQQAVEHYGWLKPGEMLDGLGMAETTPGPLIMVLQFVGFMAAFRDPGTLPPMLAGTLGGLLATWVTFTPCFLWIFLGAPFIEVLRDNKALNGALVGDHRGGGRRGAQSRDLVCAAYRYFARSGRYDGYGLRVRHAGAGRASSLGRWRFRRRDHRDLPLQGRNDHDSAGVLRSRDRDCIWLGFLHDLQRSGVEGNDRAFSPLEKESRECVVFTCLRFVHWRASAAPPTPRRSTGRRSMKRSAEALPSYPATFTAMRFRAAIST